MTDTDHFYEVPVCTECVFEQNDELKGKRVLKILPVELVKDIRGQTCNAVDLKDGSLMHVADNRMVSFNCLMPSGS